MTVTVPLQKDAEAKFAGIMETDELSKAKSERPTELPNRDPKKAKLDGDQE